MSDISASAGDLSLDDLARPLTEEESRELWGEGGPPDDPGEAAACVAERHPELVGILTQALAYYWIQHSVSELFLDPHGPMAALEADMWKMDKTLAEALR